MDERFPSPVDDVLEGGTLSNTPLAGQHYRTRSLARKREQPSLVQLLDSSQGVLSE